MKEPKWQRAISKWSSWMIVFLFAVVVVLVVVNGVLIARLYLAPESVPAPGTPTPLSSPRWTPTPTWTPTPAPTVSPTATPTQAAEPTATQAAEPTATPTQVVWPTNTPTPVIADWRGEYYDNANLTGSPAVVRNDNAVNFEWDHGAPAPGLPADAFSAQWSRVLAFDGGFYTFYAEMDDGMRVYVDGERLIDEWRDGGRRKVSAGRQLSAGNHALRVAYYERSGVALAHLWWEKSASYADWKGEYWSNQTLDGNPTMVRNDREVRFNWGEGGPGGGVPNDSFSARWTRQVDFDAGTYRFYVLVDDGARVWVDGQRIIDAWYDHSPNELTADYTLGEGAHTVKVEYYEHKYGAQISLGWKKIDSPSYPDWKGKYWSNRDLEGTPILVRNDQTLDFSWGAGSPGPDLPADNFSARWTRKQTFKPGGYRLYAQADDAIRIYVDGELVLDEWHSTKNVTYKFDLSLSGEHTLKVEFSEFTGDARVRFWWKRTSNLQEELVTR
jgi:hypothetical protein